ncbi:hypothetical protein DNTS_002773 [Danionella cerebrum]|uniref:C-type lectin domain-containing protein n=1 Tax=Danionella cerebrum TaxID=2873325 RepID=A0A553MKW9_9TELE|nr:hypothetical protein DNTS_002773 [Danionella translucida]
MNCLFVLLLSGLAWSSFALTRPYHYINRSLSWPEAQSYCRKKFTDLATVDSTVDVTRLVNIIDPGHNGSVWIGLKRTTKQVWFWSNGENVTSPYFNWAPKQPDGTGDCVVTFNGYWYDMPCSQERYFVCFKGTFFKVIPPPSTWPSAQSYCRKHYTDLATIHNSQENNQIKTLLVNFNVWNGHPSLSTGSGDCVGMIGEHLKSLGMNGDYNVSWIKRNGEEVFHDNNP